MISFSQLWNDYPTDNYPCRDASGSYGRYSNQCAIRMGIALSKQGVIPPDSEVPKCDFKSRDKNHKAHTTGAEFLALWLSNQARLVGTRRLFRDVSKAEEEIKSKTGIIFCMNFYQRDASDRGLNGDHIDLWDGNLLKTPPISPMRTGAASYINRSQQVWFWHLT